MKFNKSGYNSEEKKCYINILNWQLFWDTEKMIKKQLFWDGGILICKLNVRI